MIMTVKLDPFAAAPQLMKSWIGLSIAADGSLERSLVELVKTRSSQINGCASCINMHMVDARAARASSASICYRRGRRRHAIRIESAPRWLKGDGGAPCERLPPSSHQARPQSTSAICTALSAAPLRRLSETHHSTSPFSTVGSSRTRLI